MMFSSVDTKAKAKTGAILTAAWGCFSAYGFRKTSMDDIARGAGMSRPALYLHFKNKEAIFRALVESYYAGARHDIGAALSGQGSLHDRLARAFAAHGGTTMEMMMSSAHGMELFEASMNVAGDMINHGEVQLRQVYVQWLTAQAAAGQIVLSVAPEAMGQLICACLKGVKHSADSYEAYRSGVANYAALCAQALTPGA